jgi:ferredoxin-thioredoxin reductase catalytic subunit
MMKDQITVEAIVARFDQRIDEINIEIANISLPKPNAETYYNLEVTMQTLTRELCDLMMAKQLQLALNNKEVLDESAQMINTLPQKVKNYGCRLTPVRMSNGTKVEVLTSYFARPCHEKKIEDLDSTQPLSLSAFSTLALND